MERKEKIILGSYIICLIFCLSIILNILLPLKVYVGKSAGNSNNVINSISGIEEYIKEKYNDESVSDLKTEIQSYKILKSINLSQKELNNYYENENNISVDNTCVEVATTILEYMYSNEIVNCNDIFCDTLNYAKNKGFYKVGNGTDKRKVEKIVQYTLSQSNYTKNIKASQNNWDIYSVLKSNIDNDCLTYFNITNYAMVGAGYIEYKVTWKQKVKILFFTSTKEYTCTENFVIVNSGWFNKMLTNEPSLDNIGQQNVYQVYPEDKIKTDYLNSLMNTSKFFNIEFKK